MHNSDQPAVPGIAARSFPLNALLTGVLIGLAFCTVPRFPPTTDVDSSWAEVLNLANRKGMQFGTDIVFTYGPLGYLTTSYFSEWAIGLRNVANIALSLVASTGVCLLSWRLRPLWRILTLAFFCVILGNIPHSPQDLLIYLGMLCWGLLCFLERRGSLSICAGVLACISVFAGLTKISSLVFALLTIGAVAVDLFLRHNRRVAVLLLLVVPAGIVIGWVAAGQDLSGLPSFLSLGSAISKAYAQTMGFGPSSTVLILTLLVVLTALAAVCSSAYCFLACHHDRARAAVIGTWLACLVFLTWKHGFVRADDYHVVFFLGFAPVLTFLLGALALDCPKPMKALQVAGLLCTGLCLAVFQCFLPKPYLSLSRPVYRAIDSTRILFQPAAYRQALAELTESERQAAALPKLRAMTSEGTVDLLGNFQTYALFNRFNFRPRPVFQSYAAYTADLMRLNESFYSGPNAPAYVLVHIGGIDSRFPPLEDARALRHVLMNYSLAGVEGPFLLLKSNRCESAKLTLLKEGTVSVGDRIDLRPFGQTNIWMEVSLEPTLLGRTRQFLYKDPEVYLLVTEGPGTEQPRKFRAPVPMLQAGFIASPLLIHNQYLLNLHTRGIATRPTTYTVTLDKGTAAFWKAPVCYRIYEFAVETK
jgi:hypothetical protein